MICLQSHRLLVEELELKSRFPDSRLAKSEKATQEKQSEKAMKEFEWELRTAACPKGRDL